MKMRSSFHAFCAIPLACAFYALNPAMTVAQSRLVVDDDKVECPNAGFTRIQDAIDSATPGAFIRVCKGNYVEQVTIGKPLTIEADSGAVLMPGAMLQNATSIDGATPFSAAMVIAETSNVSIRGLVVDGAQNAISGCSPRLIGILLRNASGTLTHLVVRNFKLSASLNGCQSGTGIFVQSSSGASDVTIENSTIHDYQKNGITANEVGTQVSIQANVVTGLGPTTGAAQNGIQIAFGAAGSISRNTVTNNIWSPCTAVDTCDTFATNILVFESDGVVVSQNRAGIGQVGVVLHGTGGSAEKNETFATSVFDGIRVEGDQNQVRGNHVFNGAEAGIFISGNNNVVEHNVITEASVGILKVAGSSGNFIQANQIFGGPVTVQDPPLPSAAKVSPER